MEYLATPEETGVRAIINRNPAIFAGIMGLVTATTIYMFLLRPAPVPQSYFSDDDGKTFFTDAASKVPPFDHHGKQADEAAVFSCDGGKTRYVGYLTRFTGDNFKRASELRANTFNRSPNPPVLFKKPGDPDWVGEPDPIHLSTPETGAKLIAASKRVAEIRRPRCPDGSDALRYDPD